MPLAAAPCLAGDWLVDTSSGCKALRVWAETENNRQMTVQWSGSCKDGFADGEGTLSWILHDDVIARDTGTFQNGALNGTGKRENLLKHWVYVGDFRNGAGEGKGRIDFPDAYVYDGDWKGNAPDGVGRFTFPNGNVYEGDVKRGLKIGHGKLTFSNGDYFDGPFVNDVAEGEGICQAADTGKVAACIFKDGKMAGWK